MKKRFKYLIIIIIGLSLFFIYLIFIPSYKFKMYKLIGFPNLEFTEIKYESFFDTRKLYIVPGNYKSKSIPKHDYVSVEYHGFDSSYRALISCLNESITVYYTDGLYRVDTLSSKIKLVRVDNDYFNSLKNNDKLVYLEGYSSLSLACVYLR